MTPDRRQLLDQFERLLQSQLFDEAQLDPAIVQRHIALLGELDRMGTGALSLYDLHRREHVYFSPRYQTDFGWDLARLEREGAGYSNEKLHPEDWHALMEAGIYFTRLTFTLAPEVRRNYRLYSDYRIRGSGDEYLRVLEQQSVLESDPSGNVWLAVSTLDRSPYSDVQTPFRCRMIDRRTGELFVFPPPDPGARDPLSLREKEVLRLISKGLVSREIADLLYISVNTVNTHRQRIIAKLDVSNTTEAIRYALEIGMLTA